MGILLKFSHVKLCEEFQALIWCEIFHTWNRCEFSILVPHVKFLICIHFKHVSGVNQLWNRPYLMRIFCTGFAKSFKITSNFFWDFGGVEMWFMLCFNVYICTCTLELSHILTISYHYYKPFFLKCIARWNNSKI